MAKKITETETKLADCTIRQFTDALIRGNGFGTENLWIKVYFNGAKYGVVEHHMGYYEHNIAQYVMADYFEKTLGYKKTQETAYDESGEIAVTYESLEYDLGKYKKVFKDGYVMYEKGDDRVCVSINVYNAREIVYRIYTNGDHENILVDWLTFARKNNLYRGKKITADCTFLKLSDVSWDDVILQPKVIKVIRENVSDLFALSDVLKANNLSMKRGVIFAGPPGTGKTMISKVLARETDATVIYALPSHLDRAAEINRVCEMAKDLAPCILMIEDIDWIAENREESANAGAVIQLMNQLDGLQEFADVITIATTNNIEKIEDAVKNRPGRFDRVIKVPKPDSECRTRMLISHTKDIVTENVDFLSISNATKGLSGAHIRDLCKTAAFKAAIDGSYGHDKKVILKQMHFEAAMKEVSAIDYSTYHKTQESGKKIGFLDQFNPKLFERE